MKKIALLLLSAILLSAFASCGEAASDDPAATDTADTAAETTSEETTTARPMPEVESEDLGGYEFRVLKRKHKTEYDKAYLNFTMEAENGEPINDAMIARDIAIEERYNVKLSQILSDIPKDTASEAILAGDDMFDAVQTMQSEAYSLASNGMLLNLYEVPYIDLTAEWWDRSLTEQMTINDTIYYATGDITLFDDMLSYCTLFNKKMWNDMQLDDPYKMVTDGIWTIDKLAEVSAGVNADLDGDGDIDAYDRWGLQSEIAAGTYMFFGSGEHMITNRGDSLELTLGDERTTSVVEKVMGLLLSGDVMIADKIKVDGSQFGHVSNMFQANNLMMRTTTFQPTMSLRNMDADFGVLPIPKYEEAQENYCSGATASVYVFCVPKTAVNVETTGMLLEALAVEGMVVVNPAFYEVSLQGKVLRDSESEAMLDIIFSNKVYDIGYMFGVGGLGGLLTGMVDNGTNTLSSSIESLRKSIERSLETVVENLGN
nr:hypothetical protein [Clostridia bacterium]